MLDIAALDVGCAHPSRQQGYMYPPVEDAQAMKTSPLIAFPHLKSFPFSTFLISFLLISLSQSIMIFTSA